jgi:hypothetical protein
MQTLSAALIYIIFGSYEAYSASTSLVEVESLVRLYYGMPNTHLISEILATRLGSATQVDTKSLL